MFEHERNSIPNSSREDQSLTNQHLASATDTPSSAECWDVICLAMPFTLHFGGAIRALMALMKSELYLHRFIMTVVQQTRLKANLRTLTNCVCPNYSQLAAYVESKVSLGTSLKNSFNHLMFRPAAQTFLKVMCVHQTTVQKCFSTLFVQSLTCPSLVLGVVSLGDLAEDG